MLCIATHFSRFWKPLPNIPRNFLGGELEVTCLEDLVRKMISLEDKSLSNNKNVFSLCFEFIYYIGYIQAFYRPIYIYLEISKIAL